MSDILDFSIFPVFPGEIDPWSSAFPKKISIVCSTWGNPEPISRLTDMHYLDYVNQQQLFWKMCSNQKLLGALQDNSPQKTPMTPSCYICCYPVGGRERFGAMVIHLFIFRFPIKWGVHQLSDQKLQDSHNQSHQRFQIWMVQNPQSFWLRGGNLQDTMFFFSFKSSPWITLDHHETIKPQGKYH